MSASEFNLQRLILFFAITFPCTVFAQEHQPSPQLPALQPMHSALGGPVARLVTSQDAAEEGAEEGAEKTTQKRDTGKITRAKPQECGFDPSKLRRVIPTLQQFVDDGKFPGAVVAVVRGNKLVLLDSVGYRSISDKLPMREDTIFRIYSMTKPVTSVAAMMLIEQGKIGLEDPVAKFIPAFGNAQVFSAVKDGGVLTVPLKRPVTIRDLMRHTSGLTYGFFGESEVDLLYRKADVLSDNDTAAQLAAKVAAIPLMFQPGTRFQYSVSVDVLGRVIEIASGMKLDEYFQTHIFEPLGMVDTGFYVRKDTIGRFSTNYEISENGQLGIVDSPETSRFSRKPRMLSGGGGLVSTVMDYLRFAQMLRNKGVYDGRRLLKATSVSQMTRNQLPADAIPISVGGSQMPGMAFGLGLSVYVGNVKMGRVSLRGEYGWDGMASTSFWSSPESDITVVLLTQRFPYSPQLEMAVRPLVYEAVID